MPRDGSGVASPVAGTNTASSSTVIQSTLNNSNVNDIYQLMNTAWPVSLGGTGGTTQITSWDALSARGTDVATAATVNLTTATGPDVNLTGTTTITAITLADKDLRFARVVTGFSITASATLVVNGKTSGTFPFVAEDRLLVSGYGSSTVRVSKISGYGFQDGTVALPGLFWNADTDTGIRRVGANELSVVLGGADIADFKTTLVNVPDTYAIQWGGNSNFQLSATIVNNLMSFFAPISTTGLFAGGGIDTSNSFATSLPFVPLGYGQIKFPASQNASANANTLDDYAEITTTPTPTSGSGTLTTVSCTLTYTKIGNRVSWNATVTITTVGTGAGNLLIPLPFTAGSDAAVYGQESSTTVAVCGRIASGGGSALVLKYDGTTILASGRTIFCGGTYRV